MPVTSQAPPPTMGVASGGREPRRTARAAEISTLDVKHNFLYLVHPLRWDVYVTDKGPEILPSPTELEFMPGLAGVLPVKGEPNGDPSYAITVKQAKGWIVVPDDFEVTAFEERRKGYVHVYDSRGGPDTHHCPVWVRPYPYGGQWLFQRDARGYHQFLRDVAAKVMPAMDPNVRRGLENKLREMHRTAKSASGKSYMAEGVASALEEKIEAFKIGDAPQGIGRPGRSPKPAPKASSGDGDA